MTFNPDLIFVVNTQEHSAIAAYAILLQLSSFLPWRSRQLFRPKYRYLPTRLTEYQQVSIQHFKPHNSQNLFKC